MLKYKKLLSFLRNKIKDTQFEILLNQVLVAKVGKVSCNALKKSRKKYMLISFSFLMSFYVTSLNIYIQIMKKRFNQSLKKRSKISSTFSNLKIKHYFKKKKTPGIWCYLKKKVIPETAFYYCRNLKGIHIVIFAVKEAAKFIRNCIYFFLKSSLHIQNLKKKKKFTLFCYK